MVLAELLPTAMFDRLGLAQLAPQAFARAAGWQRLTRENAAREKAPVAQTPTSEISRRGAARLLRYRSPVPTRFARPVLLCPSLINRHYILDLTLEVSLVQMLLQAGHDVYIIDWGDPGPEEVPMRLSDFVSMRLMPILEDVCQHTGADDVHVVGHCLGGTLATMLAAIDARRIASLVNLTVPIDFADDGMLASWARMPLLDVRALADALGHVPSWLTQPAFMWLRPLGQPAKLLRLYQKLGSEKFVSFFRCMETWINDGVDVPKYFFVDLIEQLYRENRLVQGQFRLGRQCVHLSQVQIPVLTVCAQDDHIVSTSSALAGHERYGSQMKRAEVFPGGHLGVVVGGLARRNLWPLLHDWLHAHALENELEAQP